MYLLTIVYDHIFRLLGMREREPAIIISFKLNYHLLASLNVKIVCKTVCETKTTTTTTTAQPKEEKKGS